MGFSKIGVIGRLSLFMLIKMVTIPCYKGKIALPNGEVVDIVLCVDEKLSNTIWGVLLGKISVDKAKGMIKADISEDNNG